MGIIKAKLLITITTLCTLAAFLFPHKAHALVPYTRPSSILDLITFPPEDPFKILEHSPLAALTRGGADEIPAVALARADWRETPAAHEISLDIPGMKKEDIKIEVEGDRVVRVSGERRAEEEVADERWHRAERTAGKFWRRFRLPENADLEKVSARLEDGVLRISVGKLGEKEKKEAKVISIIEGSGDDGKGMNVKTSKQEL